MDAKTYIDDIETRLYPTMYEEVEDPPPSMRWFHDKVQHVDWLLGPTDDASVEQVGYFIDFCLGHVVERRHKKSEVARDLLTPRYPDTICPVVITPTARDDVRAFITNYMPQLRQTMTWARVLLPVLVEVDSGTVTFPEHLPPRLSMGGVAVRACCKAAAKEAVRLFAPSPSLTR